MDLEQQAPLLGAAPTGAGRGWQGEGPERCAATSGVKRAQRTSHLPPAASAKHNRSGIPAWRKPIDGSGATSPSVEGLLRQGRGEAGKGRGPNVAQQRLGRSARSALRIPRQITEKGCPKAAFFSYLAERGGLSGASMHPIPVRAAPRDPPSAVRFCSCRTVEPRRGVSPPIPSARQTQKGHPVGGPFAFVWRREGDSNPRSAV